MSEKLSEEKVKEWLAIEGEVRGMAIKSHAEFILKEKGKEGLKRLEKRINELGYPFKSKQIGSMGFYPIGLEVLVLLVVKELFGFKSERYE